MDSFLGIGGPELILILILAGIVMGPERMGQVARWLGRMTAQLRLISRSFTRQLNAELDALNNDDLKSAMHEVKDLQRQLAELKGEIKSVATSTLQEGRTALAESREALEQTIKPPLLEKSKSDSPNEAPSPGLSDSANGASATAPKLPSLVDVPDDPE